MNCNNCGSVVKQGEVFCRYCGTRVPENINYPMSEEATVLLTGTQTHTQNSYQEQQTVIHPHIQWNSQPEPPKKKSNTGLIVAVIIMAVIIVAGIAAIIGYSVGNKEAETVPATTTESPTQTVEVVAQQDETTSVPTTAPTTAPTTTVPTTVIQQTIPTFTYNDNNTASSSQFLFDSANQYITRYYLSNCSRDEITIIMNEIYARHGYIFKDAELREYFNSQSWYHGTTTSMEEAAKYFNTIEQTNVNTIYQYQKDMGWRE